MANVLAFVYFSKKTFVFGNWTKIFSINFWVKFTFFCLPVPGWWNGINIIWQIVSLWVLQRSCSFSVIVEAVYSKLPQLSLFCYLFWLSSIVNYLSYYWMTIKVVYSVLSSWTIFVIWVINSDEQRQLLFRLCLYWQWLQVSLQETR